MFVLVAVVAVVDALLALTLGLELTFLWRRPRLALEEWERNDEWGRMFV